MPVLPPQRWHIAESQPEQRAPLIQKTGLSPLLAQVLLNRGIDDPDTAHIHLNPEQSHPPDPLVAFEDLQPSVEILAEAIADAEPIVICGDYDADGMTSTGLLIRALKAWGADVSYAIPSRMDEGYGINTRIVMQCAEAGVGVILTVDNGIAAFEPIQTAVELGLSVIITDHHDLPDELPPADAILNPKLLPEESPYRTLAGVGVAYLLAVALGAHLGMDAQSTQPLLELCTLGTIADLAALTGVNRQWVKQGLRMLPKSQLAGIRALMEVSGVLDPRKPLRPDAIGFRLGPRINAVGRIGDPVHVIELLTTDDPAVALEQATHCENTNRERQQKCQAIETEALEVIETEDLDAQRDRVLMVFKPDWHHGVIGIVASRLVEHYGVPVFICTNEGEGEGEGEIRGSARGIPEFDVYAALKFCDDLLPKYGGHRAAGGFSFPAENLSTFRQRLSEFAYQCLEPQHLKPLVKIDAQADFRQLTAEFYDQIEDLQPWGMGNPTPVFWSDAVRVINQKTVKGNHLKLTLAQDCDGETFEMKAIAWRWGDYYPLPQVVDIAYKLTENHWQGNSAIELDIVGVRSCTSSQLEIPATGDQKVGEEIPPAPLGKGGEELELPPVLLVKESEECSEAQAPLPIARNKAEFMYRDRPYECSLAQSQTELRIRNGQGKVLAVKKGQRTGLLGESRETAVPIDVTQPHYYSLIKTALAALENGSSISDI